MAGLNYADQADAANMNASMAELATDLDSRVVPRYATTAARDSAIVSPTNGQICYVSDTAAGANNRAINLRHSGAWVPIYRSPIFAYKTAQESVTSNTTVQADDHLVLALEANAIYTLDMLLLSTGVDAGDLKYNFTYPANCSVAYGAATYNTASTGAAPVINSLGAGVDATSPTADFTAGTITGVTIAVNGSGLVNVGSTAGSLTLMWAQNASSGTATTLEAGSWIRLTRVQ